MVNSPKIIRVTAAILEKDGKILIAKRETGDELFAGLWEFPGGKIEEGETPEECMAGIVGLRRSAYHHYHLVAQQ